MPAGANIDRHPSFRFVIVDYAPRVKQDDDKKDNDKKDNDKKDKDKKEKKDDKKKGLFVKSCG